MKIDLKKIIRLVIILFIVVFILFLIIFFIYNLLKHYDPEFAFEDSLYDNVQCCCTQELSAFNSGFENYMQKENNNVSNIKFDCEYLIDNANLYSYEPRKVPSVTYKSDDTTMTISYENDDKDELQKYIDGVTNIRKEIKSGNSYKVNINYRDFKYFEGKIVEEIVINDLGQDNN